MKLLIKQARVVDPNSPFNDQITDIFIEDGIIRFIGNGKTFKADQEMAINGQHVSPGWVDIFSNFADPGYEYKETIESGAAAAIAGGFTDVFVIPNTKPAIHNKSTVEYIVRKSKSLPISIHPIGAISHNLEGKELAEMYDMRASGAIAFGDGINSLQSAGLLLKALQYVKAFSGVVIQIPDDQSISPHGLMNEGTVSTRMGLAGKPAMAEELFVSRDIKLAEYTGSAIHITGISTAGSVEQISKARKNGIKVTCSVSPAQLYFTDEDLKDYNTFLKVNPPIRSKEDRNAICAAVKDGSIDCIAAHHMPHEPDSKVLEFEYAKTGMTSLETVFGVLGISVKGITVQRMVELLAVNPRKIFSLSPASIKEGEAASITIFDPKMKWQYEAASIKSRSKNSPFIGRELLGKALAIVHKGEFTSC